MALLTTIVDDLLPLMDVLARLSERVGCEMMLSADPEATLEQSGLPQVWAQLDRLGIPPP